MPKTWISNMQTLLSQSISADDLFLVKLLAVNTYNDYPRVSVKLCLARLESDKYFVEWHINDVDNEFLEIIADKDLPELGRLEIDDSLSYSIIGCRMIKQPRCDGKYVIVDKETDCVLAATNTKKEAQEIQRICKKHGLKSATRIVS